MSDADLFADDAIPTAEAGRTLCKFFLTNRFNFLEILSSQMVKPREGFQKYYEDLLARAECAVPILSLPLPSGAVAAVSGDGAFPVLLEFLDAQGDGPVSLVERCIPVANIAVAHFRSQEELAEHSAREYANVDLALLRYEVSPELFVETGDPLPQALGHGKLRPDYMRIDKSAGGLAAWAGVAQAAAREWAVLAACLGGGQADDALSAAHRAVLSGTFAPRAEFGGSLFIAAAVAASEVNPAEGLPLAQVLSRMKEIADLKEPLDNFANKVMAVSRNKIAVADFTSQVSFWEQAVMALCLWQDIGRIKASSDLRADAKQAAAFLVGCFTGFASLDRACLPQAAIRDEIVSASARYLNGDSPLHYSVEEPGGVLGAELRLDQDGKTVAKSSRTPEVILFELDVSTELGAKVAMEVAKRLNLNCVQSSFTSPPGEYTIVVQPTGEVTMTVGTFTASRDLNREKWRTCIEAGFSTADAAIVEQVIDEFRSSN